MKIHVYFLLFFLITVSSTFSQQIGFRTAFSFSTISGDITKDSPEFKEEIFTGFSIGYFLQVPLSEKLDFMPEINYTQKGLQLSENDKKVFPEVLIMKSLTGKLSGISVI